MVDFVSAEQLLSTPVGGKSSTPPVAWKPATELLGQGTPEPSFFDQVKGFVTDPEEYKQFGKTLLGTIAQISDMGTSVVGGIASMAPYAGVRVQAALKGESAKVGAQAAMEAGNQVLPQELQTPWAKVAEALGPDAQKAYENNPVAWVMGKISGGVEKLGERVETKAGLQGEDIQQLFKFTTSALGAAGIKHSLGRAVEARTGNLDVSKSPFGVDKGSVLNRPVSSFFKKKEAAAAEPPTIDTVLEAATEEPKTVGELLVMDTPDAVKALFKKAKENRPAGVSDTAAVETIFEKAKARGLAQVGPKTPEQAIAESRARIEEGLTLEEARAKIDAEDAGPPPLTDLDTAIAKTRAGRAFDLTATEKLSLDHSLKVKGGLLLDQNGRPFERGSVDPDLLKGILAAGGVAAYVASHPEDAEQVAWIAGGALAIKGKGGNWHPEAVTRLAEPLETKLGFDPTAGPAKGRFARVEFAKAQADRMVRGYLQKHAGTATDPLKDMRLPDGTRWEDITDTAFRGPPARNFQQYEVMQNESFNGYAAYDGTGKQVSKTFGEASDAQAWAKENKPKGFEQFKPDEPVWTQGQTRPFEALKSYLSHVGDFLRMNVKLEDLAKYDLVRAVKESAANDARVAKEMEKAAAASTKDLPVYKDYGDGMKWVELKLPETLTKEQAKTVRPMTEHETSTLDYENRSRAAYIALDAQGKPIRNNYIKDWAVGFTPAEAYLAGKLAEEGNCMGHCVGGYVNEVASGATRILSLRDKKGGSHVTVELQSKVGSEKRLRDWATRNRMSEAEARAKAPLDILQIKGKQNKAPVDAYLPYVQDLVKSGEWGEVRDLQNTGLSRTRDGRYLKPEEYEAELRAATKDMMQRGSADPKHLAAIALGVAAGAAFYNSDNPENLLAGALGIGAIAAKGKGVKGALEADLLAKIREGGKEAQLAATELYRQNAPRTLRMLEQKFGHRGLDLEEILQEAMTNSMASVANGTFRGDSKFSTYLHKAAMGDVFNALEKRTNRGGEHVSLSEPTPGESGLLDTLGHSDTPEKASLNQSLGEKINSAMEKLDPRLKDTFVAVEAEGLSYAEAAERFGVPEGTIKSRLNAAKTELQRYLREYRDLDTGESSFGADRSTPRRGAESGFADAKHLAGLAAVSGGAALGAYLDPEHPIHGAIYGAGFGAVASQIRPKAIAEAIKRASDAVPMITIDDMTRSTVYARKVAAREAYKLSASIEARIPEVARREAIFRFLDGNETIQLSALERKVAGEVREFYNTLGESAKSSGVIRELLSDYATRIYGPESRSILQGKMVGNNTSLESPFGKRRAFPTLEEALAAGHVPVTIDIAKVVEAYSKSVTNAMENRNFVRVLKDAKTEEGVGLVAKEGKAPREYVFIDHPQLRGLRVHPDIAGDLKFIFDAKDPGAIIRGLDAINTTQKRMAVSFSLFHAMALEHAMLGATSILKSPVRGLRIAGQSFAPVLFGENLAVKMIREGGAGDLVDHAQKSGLEFGFERASPALEELNSNFYQMMDGTTKFLDTVVPQLGTQTVGRFTQINHLFDRAMWGRFHAALKLETFADKASELSRNNARAVEAGREVAKSKEEIGRAAASFTNDVYGGLNWQGMVQEFNSRWGREIAGAVYSPAGRLGMRMVLFAPDWTISTTRAFLKAFGQEGVAVGAGAVLGTQALPDNKILGGLLGGIAGLAGGRIAGLKGTGGSGIRGLIQPTELADLHRQYVLRSALIYTAAVDTINYQMSGHHIWDNKDPTRLDRGDGTTQQVSKHFMEPIHWLLTPRQQALNKLSFVVKEPLAQTLDAEYLSVNGAPRMGKTPKGESVTLGTRLKHVAKQFNPISVQQSYESGSTGKAAAGFFGMPIYGKTEAERAAAKAEAKQKAIQRRIDKRARGEG